MIYVFVPYYNEDTPEFKKSLESQTVPYRLIKRNRKKCGILWTKSVNDFWRDSFNWGKDDDIVCIMNNDIEFDEYLFTIGSQVKQGEVFVPLGSHVSVEWGYKYFYTSEIHNRADSFTGHCFFMNLKDFRESGGFCKLLPHALADIDFGLGVARKLKLYTAGIIIHKDHDYEPCSIWSWRSYENPILWTIFLLRHPNKYTLLNILKAWYDAIRLFRKS